MKKTFQVVLLIAISLLAWWPVLFNNSFFADDNDIISRFHSSPSTIAYIFAPHNEHFMPMYKAVFFCLIKLFGTNIVPCMLLSIIFHTANMVLLFLLASKIFPKRKWLPFLAAVLFGVNYTLFSTLHWFILLCTIWTLFFLLLTLLLFHHSCETKSKPAYWAAVFSSFFISMNYSLGILGIVIIVLYYLFIIKKRFPWTVAEWIEDVKILFPFGIAWLSYMIIYYFSTYQQVLASRGGRTGFDLQLGVILEFVLVGFVGALIKTLGLDFFDSGPFNLLFGLFLTFAFLGLIGRILIYYLFNIGKKRIKFFKNGNVLWFSMIGIFLCYGVCAMTRSWGGMQSFSMASRYHYWPIFFMTLIFISLVPSIVAILETRINPRRLKTFLIVLFVVYVFHHMLLINNRAFSTIRTEGRIEKNWHNVLIVAASTSADSLAAKPTV
jgi:hypothetical protein